LPSVGGNFLYSSCVSPPFFDKSKTDEFVLDTTLKKLLCAKERVAARHVCAGVEIP